MNKFLAVILTSVVILSTGCTPVQPAAEEEVAVDEFSDEEVVVESDDGIDPEEMHLREGDGYMMNLVESYTMPLDEGDSDATPDQVLIDQSGKEYKIVERIGPDSIQE